MGSTDPAVFRFAALSAVKHEYVPLGVAAHPRFEPVVVADDDQGGETEPSSTLHHLGDPVDADELVYQITLFVGSIVGS